MAADTDKVRNILFYRPGSLGDTLIALPALHVIKQKYPAAKRTLLSNHSVSESALKPESILAGSGLIDEYINYEAGFTNISEILKLRAIIKEKNFDMVVHLGPGRSFFNALRFRIFYGACGIKNTAGVNLSAHFRKPLFNKKNNLWESEAARLLRNISKPHLTDTSVDLTDDRFWELAVNPHEQTKARTLLSGLSDLPYIAISIGTKAAVNDWGQHNWESLIKMLSGQYQNYALLLLGGRSDFERSEALLSGWQGHKLNLCGKTEPRISAQILKDATLCIAHDSGPVHLAAAMGTSCVAIYSARNKPGVWFPRELKAGKAHKIFYNQVECFGCRLTVCEQYQKKCITAIKAEDVFKACKDYL